MFEKNHSNNRPGRYPFLRFRQGIWREIVRYVQRDIKSADTLIELGAGYGDFINQFPAQRKLAFDLNEKMRPFFDRGVEFHAENAEGIGLLPKGCADIVFASNFLEHLDDNSLERLIPLVHRVLVPGGHLVLLQPNYRLCEDRYFDDETHLSIFSDRTIGTFLSHHGFDVIKLIPGLLPFSMKSRMPKWPILVRLYLLSPVKPLAAQMYIIAKRR